MFHESLNASLAEAIHSCISARVISPFSTPISDIKGVVWMELDNGAVIIYDNVYICFVCGFNNNGDVAVTLTATGGTGMHSVNLSLLLDMS